MRVDPRSSAQRSLSRWPSWLHHLRTAKHFYLGKSFTPMVESREVGYVALSDKLYEASAKRFNAGTTGTLFPKGAEVGATLDRYLQ